MYKNLLLMLLLFVPFYSNAQLPNYIQNIILMTAATDGVLTREMHTEFWNEIKQSASKQEIDQLKTTLSAGVLFAQEYQAALWGSAKISYENYEVVKSQKLIKLENRIPLLFDETAPYPKGSKEYSATKQVHDQRMSISVENARLMLESAANHKKFISVQGQEIDLTPELINTVIHNLDRTVDRLKRLFNDKWQS